MLLTAADPSDSTGFEGSELSSAEVDTMEKSFTSAQIEGLLLRLQEGDANARDEMINVANDRMVKISRRMFRDFPRLRQWEQTEDVSQNAAVRLRRALEHVKPKDTKEFYGLVSLQIRRVLLDMTRSIYGRDRRSRENADTVNAEGLGPVRPYMHVGGVKPTDTDASTIMNADEADVTYSPDKLAVWGEFHQYVDNLPEDLRTVVDLLFYQGLTQQEAADALGVNSRTVKRRWRDAREALMKGVQDWVPGI